jgi:ankyrin repeat protein
MRKASYGILALLALAGTALFSLPSAAERMAPPSAPPQAIAKVTNLFELIDRGAEPGALDRLRGELAKTSDVDQVHQDQNDTRGYNQTLLTEAVAAVAPNQQFASDVRPNRYDVLTLVLEKNPDVNQANGNQDTPLMVAASKGDVFAVTELLKRGADINAATAQNGNPKTALTASFPFGINAFRILMAAGATYDAKQVLDAIMVFARNEQDPYLQTFLSYPVAIPADYAQRLDYAERNSDPGKKKVAAVIRRQIKADEAAGRPAPLFKKTEPVKTQILPPAESPAIVAAVLANDLAKVKDLLKAGADVNAVSRAQRAGDDYKDFAVFAAPLLHIAILKHFDDIAVLLIDSGANVNLRDAAGNPPLVLAARAKNTDIVQKLLDKGADVDREELNYGGTALEAAGNAAIMQLLIAKGADVNHVAKYGSVMQDRVAEKDRDGVKLLVAAKGDINLPSADGATPLQNLLQNDYNKTLDIDYVKFIVGFGADLQAKNGAGFTAYDIARSVGRKDIADYLESAGAASGDQARVLNEALYRGDADTVKKVLDKGYDAKDAKYAFAALGFETKPATLEIIRMLADHGTDLAGTDSGRQGASLLHVTDNPDVIDFLVSRGVDVNAVSGSGRQTPLHVMARAGKAAAVAALLKNKAFPNAVDSGGATPLCAALNGPQDQRPADGPAVDWPKDSPPFLETIRLLAKAGADPAIKDERNCAPWTKDPDYAAFRAKAEQIIAENRTAPATRGELKVAPHYAAVPEGDTLALFKMVGLRAINRKYLKEYRQDASGGGCDLPVLDAAGKLYEANKDIAPDLPKFLDRLTLRTTTNAVYVNGMPLYPDWQLRGYNLLHLAAYFGDLPLVNGLLAAGMDAKATDAGGNTAIYYATHGAGADMDDVEKIIATLKERGTDINARNNAGESAILTTSFMTFIPGRPALNYELINFMLRNGADVIASRNGTYNLADVAESGRASAERYKRDANAAEYRQLLDTLARDGVTPQARQHDDGARREKLLNDPLFKAIRENDLAAVRAAATAGADINERVGGSTPLFSSVDRGDETLDITRFLLDKGARTDAAAGYEPLLARATLQENHEKTVRLLLDRGVTLSPFGLLELQSLRRGYLNAAAQKALGEILDTGIDPNVCGPNEESPLRRAVEAGNLEAAELLVQHGAQPGFCGKNLTLAAAGKLNPQITAALLQAKPGERPSIAGQIAAIIAATPGCKLGE